MEQTQYRLEVQILIVLTSFMVTLSLALGAAPGAYLYLLGTVGPRLQLSSGCFRQRTPI